jgi:hypothetical protein
MKLTRCAALVAALAVWPATSVHSHDADGQRDPLARFLDYSPPTRLLVVGQEDVLAEPHDPYATGCEVIRVFAKALYCVTGTRPVDPNGDRRGRDVQ